MKTAGHTARAMLAGVLTYLRGLTPPRMLLWCYLLWYAVVAVRYFDPSVRLWASSAGMSAVIGTGLYLSTVHAGRGSAQLGFWPIFRFYLMPFCVSSFSALIKGHEFVFIFHPTLADNLLALFACGMFCGLVTALKWLPQRSGRGIAFGDHVRHTKGL